MSGPARQPLTRRQAEVLAAASDGVPLRVVAQRLGITRERVAARLSEAYGRLDVAWMDRSERRAAAVRIARKRGLIPNEPNQEAA
ncbi:LuxR C-terminal-related transcriptional regulator [Streptomyces zaomyceticus]|uniref:LuxR C-terminal-related transcriptional regulator n=1 Tax=Streptomyces zaomyceticus TaxID=68286 RepID=UPI002E15A2FB|nr:LuxR C-terminal-related transcriptional regulator [Streptomyces zaomyceticus]